MRWLTVGAGRRHGVGMYYYLDGRTWRGQYAHGPRSGRVITTVYVFYPRGVSLAP
jgi:hypothetical protein